MHILQLCKKFPYPPHDGEVLAINSLTKGFHAAGHRVAVLAMNTDKHYFPIENLPENMRQQAQYTAVDINTKINPFHAFLNLFSTQSYNIQRFDNQDFRNKLIELLQQNNFDIIQMEGLYLTPYIDTIRQYAPKALLSMRAHNVEFEIWERLAKACPNPLKKRYLSLLAKRLRRYEIAQLHRFDALVPITQKDADYFRALGANCPIQVCPTGIDTQQFIPNNTDTEYPSVFHLGAMDWLPNQEGVQWFLDKVWGQVQQRFPQLRCYLAGRNMPENLQNKNKNGVEIVGEVPDAPAFLRSKAIGIVPLLSGSGMRIKLIEAMALGKTMVSTSVGAEGIAGVSGRDFLLADTPQAFADAICHCIENPDSFRKIGENARQFIIQHFDYLEISRKLLAFYANL